MIKQNLECQICGKRYHGCSSCGLQEWEYKFCTNECLKKYQLENIPKLLEKYNLTINQLSSFIEDIDLLYLDYEYWKKSE